MDIRIKDIVTLEDDNDYVVVSKVLYDNKNYVYLSDVKNFGSIKILRENEEKQCFVEFENPELIKTLIPLFLESSSELIEEMKTQIENTSQAQE